MIIAGTDEVGWGTLAGPLVAVTVVLNMPDDEEIDEWWPMQDVGDSKVVLKSAARRIRLTSALPEFIIRNGGEVGIGIASVEYINTAGYAAALSYALSRSVQIAATDIGLRPDMLIVDGNNYIDDYAGKQRCVPKADGNFFAVAAASILGKIYRDNLMEELAKDFPGYEWEKNKGYGTVAHRNALLELGTTAYHRKEACETVFNKLAPRRRPPGW